MGCYDIPSICIFVHLPPISPTTIYSRCCFLFILFGILLFFLDQTKVVSNVGGVFTLTYEHSKIFVETMIKTLNQNKLNLKYVLYYTITVISYSKDYQNT